MAGKLESDSLEEAYFDRNQAVQALGRMAQRLRFRVGLKPNEKDPDWPILMIDLPTGQVSWHLPRTEIVGKWPEYEGEWDGHDLEEKRRRIGEFIAL